MAKKEIFGLMNFFEGYVRNFRRLNLHEGHNRSMFTKREVEYFANLGEFLGYDVFVEDFKPVKTKLKYKSRPMDLSWWKDGEDSKYYEYLVLHLERENLISKADETLAKLFAKTEEGYTPQFVIGIQVVDSSEEISRLNKLVLRYRKQQPLEALMIYRFYEKEQDLNTVWAYHFHNNKVTDRKAILKVDEAGHYFMYFKKE